MSANPPSPDPKRWWALFLLCAAQFLVILDTAIVGISPISSDRVDYRAAFIGAGAIAIGAAVLSAFAARGPSKRGLTGGVAAVAALLGLAMCDASSTSAPAAERSKIPAGEHARTIEAL